MSKFVTAATILAPLRYIGMSKRAPDFPLPDQRQPILTEFRQLKMAESAHAYVRGSTTRFYEWLEGVDRRTLPEGPPVWICGDCHVGNLGPVANTAGLVEIQIRDLDQTVIGNPAHDLIRLGLSLAMAARSSDLPGVTTARMLERMIDGYEQAFEQDESESSVYMPTTVKLALRQAGKRSWKHLADERIEGSDPAIPLGKRFWPLADAEHEALHELFGQDDLRRLGTSLRGRDDGAAIEVIDTAYWRKGCSSLGRLRFAVLLAVRDKAGKDVSHCLMDVKEAVAAVASHSADAAMPSDNAERVVEGARNLSPFLGGRMLATRLLERSVFVRELLPQDLKLELEQLSREEAMKAAHYLAVVVGHAHARQMQPADRKRWRTEMQRNRSRTLDAPTWLWSSIVDLVAAHEAAYLEHCRKYALAAKAA